MLPPLWKVHREGSRIRVRVKGAAPSESSANGKLKSADQPVPTQLPVCASSDRNRRTLRDGTLSSVGPTSRFSSIRRCCNNGQHGSRRFPQGCQCWKKQVCPSERACQRTGHLRCRERGRRRHACYSQAWFARKVCRRVAPEA